MTSTRAVLVLVAAAVAACSGKGARAPVGTDNEPRVARKATPAATMPVTGHMIATLSDHTLGPFLARRGAGEGAAGLVAWISVAEGSGRRVVVVPVDARGKPRGAERTVAFVPVDTTMLVVRAMQGKAPGFVVAWTSLTDRGESLWSITLGDDGAPRAKATELARTSDDVVWVDVVPTERGATCLWAEETRAGDANVTAAALDTDGKVRGTPTRVARGVVGWHAIALPSGVGLSTVSAVGPIESGKRGRDASRAGALSFQKLDADGHVAGPPVVVSPKPLLTGDVEVVRAGARLLFAWTDRSAEEPAIVAAAIEGDGKVSPPKRLVEGRGGANLLALVAGPAGSAVMFEAPARRSGEARRVHVAAVGSELALERRPTSFEVVGDARPELAATSTGFAALAGLRDCEPDSPSCPDARVVPTLLRTDAKAALVQREPLTFGSDPAALGWGLSCDADKCFALAASSGAPSRIRAAEVRQRQNAKAPPDPIDSLPKDGPRVTDVTAIAAGESVFDLATTRFGDSVLVAMLSSRADAIGRRGDEPVARAASATLTTRLVDAAGAAASPSILSTRALVVGGVAAAPAERPEDGGAVAWVARENGDPEVHVTRVDKRGRRVNDIQLTTTKGDAADVAIAWAGGGWIVAWVDWRDGNGEVYATKVSPELTRVAREERITKAPGDASDLAALGLGEVVWLAWADSRESPRDGVADVFVTAVNKRDAKRAFDEQRLLATAPHSRSPQLAESKDGVHVAWIEEAPLGSETPTSAGYGAMWATLDDKGKPVARPARVPLAGEGAATSVSLESAISGLRAVVARSTPESIAIDAIDLSSHRASPLLMLDGPPSLDVALVMRDGVLYFNDEGPALSDRRARRARIAWAADPGK